MENTEIKNKQQRRILSFFKILGGIVLCLIIWVILFKVIATIVGIVGALGLGAIDINVSENARALANLSASANILAFIGSLYFTNKLYKKIAKKR